MSKKTLAYVVYPGISLLELVANRTLLGGIMARGALLKLQAGYEVVVVGERIEEIPTDTPIAIIPQRTFADVPQPDALVVIGGGRGQPNAPSGNLGPRHQLPPPCLACQRGCHP